MRSKLLSAPGVKRQIPLKSLTGLCKRCALRVQATHNSLMDEHDGAWPGEELDWRFPERLLLLERMNWTTGALGHDGCDCKCVTTAASISRDFWLSPAAHWVNKWVLRGGDRADLVTLCWTCTHQVSWFKLWESWMMT